MSVNPVPPTGAAGANVPLEQLIAAELNALAADAQALQTQLAVGQVVTAQVLASNGLSDLVNILGNRVAAALPPNLQPGDLFNAQVTGFDGPQILLQYLTTVQAEQPDVQAPPPVAQSPLQAPAPQEPLAAAARPVLPEGVTPSLAPPPAVFVAASVRPPPAPVPGAPQPVAPSAQAVQQPALTDLAEIEARLAAARAGRVAVNVPPPPAPAGSAPATGAAPPNAPAPAGRFVVAPPIVPSARLPDASPGRAAAPPPNGPAPPSPGAPDPPTLSAYRDPAALVRALNLPVTPTNVAAAKLAIETPQRLPAALAALESALADAADPRVQTLRTLTAFVGRLDPASPQLAQQISAYVDHVVTGSEPKLLQLLTARALAGALPQDAVAPAPDAAPPATAPAPQPAAAQSPVPSAQEPPPPPPPLPVVLLAQAAERAAALGVDLKTQLLALVNDPPSGGPPDARLAAAAASALTALTTVQVNAAQALTVTPQQMAFTLPMWTGTGYAPARIAIDRDAPEGRGRGLDGDNFHIAFVLDTKHLGTVTVDLQTVGRAFNLAVKAENESAAKRFAEAMDRLTGRLETLRYRVNSADASVAPRGAQAPQPAAPPFGAGDDDGFANNMNVRA